MIHNVRNILNLSALARQANKLHESTGLSLDQQDLLPNEDLGITNDVRLTLRKLRLKTCNDHVVAGIFILQALLAQDLPRALRLQLKKQVRRLESILTLSDPAESQIASEVWYTPLEERS